MKKLCLPFFTFQPRFPRLIEKKIHVIAIFTLVGGGGGGFMKTNPYFSWVKKKVEQPFQKHNSNSFLPCQLTFLKTTKTF
jgi:hypothetical protein